MPYWEHLKEAWNRRTDPNLLFIFYEDMVTDIHKSIEKISAFMNKSYSESEIQLLIDHLSFQSLKSNDFVNGFEMKKVKLLTDKEGEFIRKGVVNGTDYELTSELEIRIDKWIAENLEKSGISFPQL